jgi:hypothetical protein
VPFVPLTGQSYRVVVGATGPNGQSVSRTATISRTTRGLLPTLFPLF